MTGGVLGGALSLGDLAVVFSGDLGLRGPVTTASVGGVLGILFLRSFPMGESAAGVGADTFLGGAERSGEEVERSWY